ncbi:MAG: hypothetical protein QOD53_2483, partial [Thermoleophilaceae bacterium]|nr:hypothetical protein [Thermoleophilaceae bacterium]
TQARKAAAKGIPAGVLSAADYQGLAGPWVAFSGQYSSRQPAQSTAKGYAKQGFKGCHAEYVKPRPGH